MAAASGLEVLRGLSTYKARVQASFVHAYRPYPCKSLKSEAVAISFTKSSMVSARVTPVVCLTLGNITSLAKGVITLPSHVGMPAVQLPLA